MPVIEIILIIALTAIWYGLHDVPFSFAGSIRSGALRVRETGIMVIIALSVGYLLFASPRWRGVEEGWSITSPAVTIVIAVSVACTMLSLFKINPLNSVCYALTGAIWGWQLFHGSLLHSLPVLSTCLAWLLAPVLGGVVAIGIFYLARWLQQTRPFHLIHLGACYRGAIRVAVIAAAIAIGVNNAPLFLSFAHALGVDFGVNLGGISLGDYPLLWFIALLVVVAATYSVTRQRVTSLEPKFVTRKPEHTLAALLSLSAVMLLFGSGTVCARLGISVAAISPVHLTLGALLGIGWVQANRKFELATFARVVASIFVTPFLSLCLCFVLLSLIAPYGYINEQVAAIAPRHFNLTIPLLVIGLALLALFVISTCRRQQFLRLEAQDALKREQQQHHEAQQVLTGMELRNIRQENERLGYTLEIKRKELINLALNINEQRDFFDAVYQEIRAAIALKELHEVKASLEQTARMIHAKMTFSDEMSGFYSRVEDLHKHFIAKLVERFPQLSEQERRLATLLRLGFSTKDIAGLMNISPKSAEISRHRLRKKLELTREENLILFIKSL
ncbi:MAG: LuxR C-terminal-related transcriptional regulator [Odoribacteraceae bacterium]|jgi:phosphate/sulfate permease/DNA-binding CsgD family transcriptional regulator|nr:LuxR C-terminal-related transcriptional regulator [Odoribacteraceae bacterium]